MLTATAVCRPASLIKVWISINNLQVLGSWPFRPRSRCVLLPFYDVHPITLTNGSWIYAPDGPRRRRSIAPLGTKRKADRACHRGQDRSSGKRREPMANSK